MLKAQAPIVSHNVTFAVLTCCSLTVQINTMRAPELPAPTVSEADISVGVNCRSLPLYQPARWHSHSKRSSLASYPLESSVHISAPPCNHLTDHLSEA